MSNKQIIIKVLNRYTNLLHNSSIEKTLVDVLSDKDLRESFAEDLSHEISEQLKSRKAQEVKVVNSICLN